MKLFGIIVCLSLAAGNASGAIVHYVQTAVNDADATPLGAVSTNAFLATGIEYATVAAPAVYGGYRFTHWSNSGYPSATYRDYWGRSQNPTSFILLEDTTATAHYLPATRDTDGDGVPDWVEIEYYGSLTNSAAYDGDGDSISLLGEYAGNTHPLYANTNQAGGVSWADGTLVTCNLASYASYLLRSVPAGAVNQTAFAAPDTVITSPSLSGNPSFGHWTLDGVRQQDAWGVAVPQVTFTVQSNNVEGVAYLFPGDSDGDGIPDAYEQYYFGTLANDGTSDADGDGLALAQEYSGGTNPLQANIHQPGGVFWADGASVEVNLAGYPHFVLRSEPPGMVVQSATVSNGTVVTTAFLGQASFGYWSLDGQRQEDAWGVALRQITFTVGIADRDAVAHFYAADSDADGVNDGFEFFYYGSLASGAAADTDGDGYTLLEEFTSGTNPRFGQSHQEGGVSWQDSELLIVDLQLFERVEYSLAGGVRTLFFSRSPTNVTGILLAPATAPALGDWDGDGDFDLFVGASNGMMRIYENAGSPLVPNLVERTTNFAALAALWNGSGRLMPALGDWSGDGLADLAVGGDSGVIAFVRANGSFLSPPATTSGSLSVSGARTAPALADLDGDGLADLLVLTDDGRVRLYPNNGASPLPFAAVMTTDLLGSVIPAATGLAVADIDEDGDPDVLISDNAGRIWAFQNDGARHFTLISKVHGGTYAGFARRLTVAAADFDGDGDPDLIVGFAEGSLVLLRNPSRRLLIGPPSSTVVSGSEIPFSALNAQGVAWSLLRNRSGAQLNATSGVYHAGPVGGRVDVIEGVAADGLRGRAYVNVISPADITAAGKAVIIAGGRSLSDPVWKATDRLADFAYGALLYRGFSKDTLHYLSFDPNQDADGNGLHDDIDRASTLANAANTFTNWVGNANKLLVYLTDHGSSTAGAGQMRLNSGEVLTAAQLDGWLDAIQDAHQTEVVLILDFCYSGSFLDELTYNGTAKRLIFSSTGASQLTYFIAGGQVSFSSAFFGAVYQGFDLFQAFRLAQDAMSRYQGGQLDDTKDGLYQPGIDGQVARQIIAGSSFIVGRDFPLINSVLPSTTHTGGDSLRIWATDISSAYPLQRVWVTVTPPGYNPDPGGGVPVLTLPEVDLRYNPDTRRQEADLSGLTEPGSYQLLFYAQDIWGGVSLPRQSVIVQTGFDERIVLVAGGPAGTPSHAGITNLTAQAYGVFRTRGFSASAIHYLCPEMQDVDGNDTNETDAVTGLTQLGSALTTQIQSADKLTLMVVGVVSNGLLLLDAANTLSAAHLDLWLDAFQVVDKPVNVFLDFEDSGSWLSSLRAPANRTRIVVASTQPGRPALLVPNLSFTSFLLSELLTGKTIGASVDEARRVLRRASGNLRQNARMDDNANGIGNEKNADGLRARAAYLGAAFLTGEDRPNIGGVTPPATFTNLNQVVLWAGPVTDADGISEVWALVTSPANSFPAPAQRVNLAFNPGNDRYENLFTALVAPGTYTVTFFAQDTAGGVSEGVQTVLEKMLVAPADPDPGQPDGYEPDDTGNVSAIYDLPLKQQRTLHVAADADWVRFFGEHTLVYDIETVHTGTNLDTRIELYRQNVDGSLTLIDTVDEFGYAQGELAGLDFPSDGFYLVKITHDAAFSHTPGAYTLILHVPSGFTGINVTARNLATQGALTGATARLYTAGGALIQSLPVDSTGVVKFLQPVGNYRVSVAPPSGYVALFDPNNPANVPENANSTYGNARNLPAGGFGTVTYGVDAGSTAAYLGYYFVPGISVTGRVVDAVTHEPLTNVSLSLRRTSDNSLFDRYPWATYGTLWKTAAGSFPSRLILPPSAGYNLTLSLAGFTNTLQTLTAPATGPLDLGRLTLGAADSDHDGLPDAWEQANFGSLAQNAAGNPDGDAFSNAQEFQAGTQPNQNGSELRVVEPRVVGETITLAWPASAGRRYTIWSAPAPGGPWTLRADLHPPVVHSGQGTWQDPLPSERRYYRVESTFLP